MNYLKGILTEANGDFSSKRFIAVTWFTSLLILWIWACCKSISASGTLSEIPNGVYMISGVIASMVAIGKFAEEKPNQGIEK